MARNMPADNAPLIRSVLHPTDFSKAGERAFAHALAISLFRQADFTILHVGEDSRDKVPWDRFPPVRKTLEKWGLLEEGSPQSAIYQEYQVRVRKRAVKSRNPALATTKYAEEYPADLLVVATEGRQGLSRWIDRSDAEAMARWTRTMTLFVPADSKREIVAPEDGDLTLNNVLVPVDAEPDASTALEYARRAAEIMGDGDVTITALHVGETVMRDPEFEDSDSINWRSEHRQGDPVDRILEAAEDLKAELIVMTTRGHDGLTDVLRGSTTEKVLRRASCPLLAVPAG